MTVEFIGKSTGKTTGKKAASSAGGKTPTDAAGEAANALWGGRFASGPAEVMERINASIDFDRRLYAADIAASKAHAAMLAEQGIIGADTDKHIAEQFFVKDPVLTPPDLHYAAGMYDCHRRAAGLGPVLPFGPG